MTTPAFDSEAFLDFLDEVTNIAQGHASAALAQMLNRPVTVHQPIVQLVPAARRDAPFGDKAPMVATARFKLLGDLRGDLFFVVPREAQVGLVELASAKMLGPQLPLIPWDLAPVVEIGNILAGAFFAAVQQFCGISVIHSVPMIDLDLVEASVEEAIRQNGREEKFIQIINKLNLSNTHEMTVLIWVFLSRESKSVLLEAFRKALEKMGVPPEID